MVTNKDTLSYTRQEPVSDMRDESCCEDLLDGFRLESAVKLFHGSYFVLGFLSTVNLKQELSYCNVSPLVCYVSSINSHNHGGLPGKSVW
jgi:hypothetical protein